MTVPLNVQVTITGGVGAPGGGFKLIFDNATIGTSIIPVSGGTITVSIPDSTYGIVTPSGLLPGTHTVGVIYSGDSNYQAQVSSAAPVTVVPPPAATQTTITAPSTQLVVGQTVTLTAMVSSTQATGNISFIDSNGPVQTTLATIALSGNTAAASLTLSQGSHSISAQYNGDTNFMGSASNPVNITVGKANTTTTLTSPPNNSAATAGTAITLSAQVAVQAPGVATLSGSVQFLDGANVLGTRTLSGSGAASMTATLAAGSHTLTATYSGNSSLNTSSGSVAFAVNGLQTTTATPTITGNAGVGQPITISTVVSGPAGGATPTGFVLFTDSATTPATALGQVALDSKGNASLPNVAFVSAGTHFLFANYLGDTTFAPSSSGVFALSICPSSPVVGVTPSVTSPVYGQPVILTGTVSTNSATPPPGTIDFFADGQSLTGDMPLTLSNGSAQYGLASTSPLVAGAHTLIATYYCGTGTTGISSSPVSLIINSDASTTNLSVTGLQLTAVVLPVSPGYGIPTGSVQFMSGSTPLGQAVTLDSSSGVATATLSAPAAGSVVAEYSGDGNFTSSNSAPVNVMAVSTAITLTSSENPASFGDKITFTATVTNTAGSSTPTGTVAFLDGTTSLGTAVTVSSTGQAQFSTAKLTSGSHTITASFNPTGLFQAVQATIGQYVAPASGGGGGGFGPGSTIAGAADPASAVYGQTVTLTTTVTPTGTGNPPTPTGQVTYQNGSTVLGTAPVGQGLALSSLSPGTYNVTASYAGDNVYSAAQTPISFVMAKASTQTTYSPTLNQTGQATLTATVTVVAPGVGNPTGTVQFQDASENNLTITSAALAGGTATAIVDATIATHQIVAVYNGDPNFSGSSSASQLQLVSTAANITFSFAPDEAVSAYHVTNLTGDTTAPGFPLGTSLGGAGIKITDSTGVTWLAPLYGVFASASQINFVMPSTVALGPALVTALLPGGSTMTTVANITQTSPAIFTANMNGQGVAAGQFVHVAPGSVQTFDSIAVFDQTQNTYVPNQVSFGPTGDQLYLVLYGTGIRHRTSDAVVSATVNGVTVPIQTAAQGVYPGLDQMNLQLPNTLAGAGTVNVIVTVNGQTANTVQIALK